MTRYDADVLVVGAGPAGAALALALARRGRDVLLIERARFPRDKPCGDSLNPGALAELERLGILARLEARLRPRRLEGWRIEAGDGSRLEVCFGHDTRDRKLLGWAARRRDLDEALLDEALAAGARVRFGPRVFDLARAGERVVGVIAREGVASRTYRARHVVGADGLRSVVQRRSGLAKRPPRLRKIAVVAHLAGSNGAGSFGELYARGGRCCGYAPCAGTANLTLVLPAWQAGLLSGNRGSDEGDGAAAFVRWALRDFPTVAERASRVGIEDDVMVTGPFDRPVRRPWAPGVVLVGDAAGYYDPFTGQGIHQAFFSARHAAWAIDESLDDPAAEARAMGRYARIVMRELRPKRALQRVIETVVARPRLMSRFVRALGANDGEVGERLLRATGDIAHPATLLAPDLWIRLAYRLTLDTA